MQCHSHLVTSNARLLYIQLRKTRLRSSTIHANEVQTAISYQPIIRTTGHGHPVRVKGTPGKVVPSEAGSR